MEENEYRETYQDINTLPCVFERAILVRCAACEQAKRLYLAEREAVACRSVDAHIDCGILQDLMHQNARFVLHQSHIDGPLPHAQEIRVQCGGISGLADLLGQRRPDDSLNTDNIHALVSMARKLYSNLSQLPFQQIVQGISRWKSRRRGNRPD
jgi:hypothetical protein